MQKRNYTELRGSSETVTDSSIQHYNSGATLIKYRSVLSVLDSVHRHLNITVLNHYFSQHGHFLGYKLHGSYHVYIDPLSFGYLEVDACPVCSAHTDSQLIMCTHHEYVVGMLLSDISKTDRVRLKFSRDEHRRMSHIRSNVNSGFITCVFYICTARVIIIDNKL